MSTDVRPRRFWLLPHDRSVGWVPYVWLLYLANFFIAPVVARASALEWAATIGATLVFVATYFLAYWVQGRRLIGLVVVQVALGVLFSPVNFGAPTFFVYAASAAARLVPSRLAIRAVLLVTLVGLMTCALLELHPFCWIIAGVITPIIGLVSWNFAVVARSDAKLRLAQEEVARLATIAERERIARDLHDVLGHTLTLVVLKAELAGKLAERDPTAALTELRELEGIARTALGEVREAISGYRATWDDEVLRARMLLETAGVRAEFVGRPEGLGRAAEEALALALREAVTNVVRHARASTCEVRCEREGRGWRLEVRDDGTTPPPSEPTPVTEREGNGLRGLRQRVEALGGSVERHAAVPGGMRLLVTVPMPGAS